MKSETSTKRLSLAISFIIFVFGFFYVSIPVYATYLGNNTGTIDTVNEGDELNQNQGTVKNNYGRIDANMGTVTTNYNYIRVNWTNGKVTTNRGSIDTNLNSISSNYGVVKTNNSSGTIDNRKGGIVESSNGTVYNYGTVERNWGQGSAQGLVTMYEGGHVVTNDSNVETLKSASVVCSIDNNNASFEVDKATATVKNNNAGARIQVWRDGSVKVDNNAGEITLWNSVGGTNGYGGGTGLIRNNSGKITVANGATAYIVENSGTVDQYSGSNAVVYRPCVINNNTDAEITTGNGFTDYDGISWIKKGATFTVDNTVCVIITGATYIKDYNTFTIKSVTDQVTITIQEHTYGDPVILKNATCLEHGSQRRTCSVCDFNITEKIPAKGHIWKTDYAVDKEATCLEDGSESIHCTGCNETKDSRIIHSLGHEWEDTLSVDKEVSCTEDGAESIHCSRCNESKEETTVIIEKTGHSFSQWNTSKVATEIANGIQTRKCFNCGVEENKKIAQLAPTLKAVKISKPKSGKRSVTIKWKKITKKDQKKIKKVAIQYSLDKKFSKGVKTAYANSKDTSKIIKGLKKGKKYYVRLRAYTKTGKVVHVSKWSSVKSYIVK